MPVDEKRKLVASAEKLAKVIAAAKKEKKPK